MALPVARYPPCRTHHQRYRTHHQTYRRRTRRMQRSTRRTRHRPWVPMMASTCCFSSHQVLRFHAWSSAPRFSQGDPHHRASPCAGTPRERAAPRARPWRRPSNEAPPGATTLERFEKKRMLADCKKNVSLVWENSLGIWETQRISSRLKKRDSSFLPARRRHPESCTRALAGTPARSLYIGTCVCSNRVSLP
jgi:hypothetical protein